MQKQWVLSLDGTEYVIQYQGSKLSGTIKMLINGEYSEYTPTLVRKVGMFAKLDIADKDVVIKISLNGKEANLIVDGLDINNQEQAQINTRPELSFNKVNRNALLQRKVKTGLGSYLTFVVFTYVNLVLVMLNADLSFPFSATVPQIPLIFGQILYEAQGMSIFYVTGIIIALILASGYLLLFFLSRKRVVPIWITIGFIIIDTIVMFLVSLDDIGSILVDLAFHIWVIVSMINLLRSRIELNRITREELAKPGILGNQM